MWVLFGSQAQAGRSSALTQAPGDAGKVARAPDVGFRCAEVGSRMPPVVASSASATFASTKSPFGVTCAICNLRAQ